MSRLFSCKSHLFKQFKHFFSTSFRPRFDYDAIAQNVDLIAKSAEQRKLKSFNAQHLKELLHKYEEIEIKLKKAKESAQECTEAIKNTKDKTEKQKLIAQAAPFKAATSTIQAEFDEIHAQLEATAAKIPNSISEHTPIGSVEDFRIIKQRKNNNNYNFSHEMAQNYSDHLALGAKHDLFDFERGGNTAGSRFYYLKNEGALLELALINYSVAFLVRKGFEIILPPDLVLSGFIHATGFQPRDTKETQIYAVDKEIADLSLVATAEIPIAAYFAGQTLDLAEPRRVVAFGHCFRTEAGGLGREHKGLYRVHQFSKVEMFVVCDAESSSQCFDELVALQQELYDSLGLNYRVLELSSADLGSPAHRKIDCEAEMISRMKFNINGGYGEISSTSNCTDYQARRLNIKNSRGEFVHTLNGTAVAIPRMLLSIIEQFQRQDGTIEIPAVLQPYMMGIHQIPHNSLTRKPLPSKRKDIK
jgi:seryl-tRNA synthetase